MPGHIGPGGKKTGPPERALPELSSGQELPSGSAGPAGKTKEGLRMACYVLLYPYRRALPASVYRQAGKAARSAVVCPSANQRACPAMAARLGPGGAYPVQEESLEHQR